MGETPRPLMEMIARQALKSHAEAAEHIRDCARCERLFITAYEVELEQNEQELETTDCLGGAEGTATSDAFLAGHHDLDGDRRYGSRFSALPELAQGNLIPIPTGNPTD